ncbi:MAG: Ig-like domain-containing protein, partial [Fimbriimonadaceae bacterium]
YGSDDHHMSLSCIEQAPIAITDAYPSVRRNVFYRAPVSVLNNDRYATGTTITIHTAPAHGTVTMGADGIFNYTSVGNYVGPEQFRYQISRPGLATATAWVNFNIVP